jgi:hypothetical protein
MNYHQFAASMLEEEITGEAFPLVLLQMAKAFSNIDIDDRLCARHAMRATKRRVCCCVSELSRARVLPLRPHSEIDAEKILVIYRKLGVKFTVADRDMLFKQLDTAHRGAASFTEFAISFSRIDRTKLGGLAEVFKCVACRPPCTRL